MRFRLALLGLVAVSLYVRARIAARAPVWRDEAQAVAIAARSFPRGILDGVRHDGNAPLFYLLEHPFVAPRAARWRELRDRAPALLFGLALLPIAYAAARRLAAGPGAEPEAGAHSGLCAAALFALAPLAVDLSTQARSYSGLGACAALLCLGAVGAIERGAAVDWILYGAAALCALYLHSFAAYLVAGFALATGGLLLLQRRHRLRYVVTHAAIAVGFVPGLLMLLGQVRTLTTHGGRVPWGTQPTLTDLRSQALCAVTGLELGAGPDRLRPDGWVLLAAALALLLLALAVARTRRRGIVVLLGGLLGLGFAFLAARHTAAYRTRYNFGAIVIVLAVVGAGLGLLAERGRWARLGAALATVLVLVLQVRGGRTTQRKERSAARAAAQTLTNLAQPDDVVVMIPDSVAVSVNYYLAPRAHQLDLPELGRVDAVDWKDWSERLNDPTLHQRFDKLLYGLAVEGRPLWLIYWAPLRGGLPHVAMSDLVQSALPREWSLGRRAFGIINQYYAETTRYPMPPAQEALVVARYESRFAREP